MSSVDPNSFTNLSYSLTSLELSDCDLRGNFPDNIFNLPNINYLSLRENPGLTVQSPESNWTSPLEDLYMYGTPFSEDFPEPIRNLKSLSLVGLGDRKLSGSVPSPLTNLTRLTHLSVNDNQLDGSIADNPIAFPNLRYLFLSDNLLSGTPPSWIYSHPSLNILDLSNNHFTGHIQEFHHSSVLERIDLSNNTFGGSIPRSMSKLVNLTSLNLKRNKFHGVIPPIFGKGCGLKNLNLNGNRLEGSLTRSISHCKDLEVLDVGNNDINDTFPHWIDGLSELQVLVLHSNKFHGSIGASIIPQPPPKLRIIDLSSNYFVGPLPTNFIKKFKGMVHLDEGKDVRYMQGDGLYDYSVHLVIKGMEVELIKILTIFTSFDLSNNSFEGEIPTTFGELSSLRGLNLSHNNLTGHIPFSLGNLTQLEWLDLSANRLNGPIPSELLDLTFLSFLNVSYNQLVGHIPRVKQFNTFENDSYEGNEGLCGIPLSRSCSSDGKQQALPWVNSHEDNDTKLIEFGWKVVAIGYGFGFIFGAVVGYVSLRMGKLTWFLNLIGFR